MPRGSFRRQIAMKLNAALLLVCALGAVSCRAAPRAAPVPDRVPATVTPARPVVSVIPAPASLTLVPGERFVLDSSTIIVVEAATDTARGVAEALAFQLRAPTGFPLPVGPDTGAATLKRIRLHVDPARADLADEGYALAVHADSVGLVARTAAGLFRGIQTIRLLLPFGIEAENSVLKMGDWTIPAVRIVDRPRFAWRGAMLDVSRHFFTVDEVKQYIDLLALYKMNVLHLHLSDDQGWRIEIKSRPLLTATASATQVGGGPGGFYTQADYSEIVRYAAERFITIVPEIDMPGHTNAMLIPYPHLSCGRQPPATYTSIRVGFSALCPVEETYRLVDDVVRELAALTPGPYFHIGGDEVETLTREQYISFVERAQEIVARHGKRMIGWEEIHKARLQPTTLVQQWHTDSARNALVHGAKLILSPSPKVYLDMKYTADTELGLRWAGLIDVRTSYDWDPATYIAGVGESDIVGVEAPLWTETVRNITAAFYLTVPRLPAIAELAWTPQALRRWEDFASRLATHAPRWRLLGINYYPSQQVPW